MPIPNPQPGLVISYAYLWHYEHRAGREEGQKDRPCIIVLAVERKADGAIIVTVLPITHSPPTDPNNRVLADYLKGIDIMGGTGAFANAKGHLSSGFGGVDLSLGQITLRYAGTICFANAE